MNNAALITGAAKRLGKYIALKLASHGCDIAIHYNNSKKEAEDLKHLIEHSHNVKCVTLSCDLQKFASLKMLIEDAYDCLPGLNILINNASVFTRTPCDSITEDVFDENFNLNVKAPLFLCKYFAEKCKTGNIINMLDYKIHHNNMYNNYFAYALSKHSLKQLSIMLSSEFEPNIKISCICPQNILESVDCSNLSIQTMCDTIINIISPKPPREMFFDIK